MDPLACYVRWLDATTRTERRVAARDYNAWVDRGGFRAAVAYAAGPDAQTAVVDRLTADTARGYMRRADQTIGLPWRAHRRSAPRPIAAGGAR